MAGVYDPQRHGAQRFLKSAAKQFALQYPWTDADALEVWHDWWNDKDVAHGQTASESFLWSLVAAQAEELNDILQHEAALQILKTRFSGAIDEALDVCAAQLGYQDANAVQPALLMTFTVVRDQFFPYFQNLVKVILGEKASNLELRAHRRLAAAIGAAFRAKLEPPQLSSQQWTDLVEFIRRPEPIAVRLGFDWPVSRGRWEGERAYYKQMQATHMVVAKIAHGR